MIEGALKADGRLAAKNAVKIRAALRQVADFKRVFNKYQETQPQPTDNPTQDRVRARSWILLNVYINDEPLRLAVTRAWQEAFILGEVAADEWLGKAREAKKADDIEVNWDTWKPGDVDTALNIKNFQKYLAKVNADSYFKTFNKETVINLGTALSDSIELGLDAESAAVMIGRHVANPSRALTIAITEQNRAMSFSTIERYKEAGLAKMEWAVSDPCDVCAKNDGQVIVIGQTFASGDAQPPAHPHCRCVLLPVIPGMEDDPMGIDGGLAPMPDDAPVVELPTESISDGYRVFTNAQERDGFIVYQVQDKKFLALAYEKPGTRDLTPSYRGLEEYKSYGYGKINQYLRTGQGAQHAGIEQTKDYIKAIDKVMEVAPGLPEPIITYRGVGKFATPEINELFGSFKPGDIWIDKGYSSTSLDKGYVKDFANGWFVEIENPQGTKGVMIDALKGLEGHPNIESEWLLPRNTQFEVMETNPTNRTMKVRVKQ